jgi:V/A-type H+-transporting ATPase subunit E
MNELLGNLDDLVAQVHRRAEQRALSLRSSADDKAERIVAEGRERAQQERDRIEEDGRREADGARRQRLAVADLERRRRRLEAREKRLDAIWRAADEALKERAENGLSAEVLARLARHGAAQLGADEATVQLDEASLANVDEDDVAGWAPEDGPRLALADEPLERRHGVLVRAGRASVDCTLEGRLEQARERLRGEVVELLEPRAAPADDERADGGDSGDDGGSDDESDDESDDGEPAS